MSETYQSFYQGEIRALEITINDQDGNDFAPSAAWTEIKNNSGTIIVSEQPAMVTANKIVTIIGTLVTANLGKYNVIWRIVYSGHTYYHVTQLEIQELY